MRFEDELKLFGMKNLLLEADLFQLEQGGIDIGHAQTVKKDETVDVDVFEADVRQGARQMLELYYLHFCLENSVRKTIIETLKDKYGLNWWNTKVPKPLRGKVEKYREQEKDMPFSERSEEPIYYTDFKDLIEIIENNWADFSDLFRGIESVKYLLNALNVLRRPIAHSALLNSDEIQRFKLHIKDWIRIQM